MTTAVKELEILKAAVNELGAQQDAMNDAAKDAFETWQRLIRQADEARLEFERLSRGANDAACRLETAIHHMLQAAHREEVL